MALRWITAFLCLSHLGGVDAAQKCERLKASLTYTQEKAPRDLSGVLPVVVERVNRELEGVVDVEVEWTGGDLHGRVGEHTVQCKVTRLASVVEEQAESVVEVSTDAYGRQVIVQCFQLPFTIQDTNECRLAAGHPMHHKCADSAQCVNTIGSYECLCPRLGSVQAIRRLGDDAFWQDVAQQDRSAWEVSFSQSNKSSCPSQASTNGCCAPFAHSTAGQACRAAFSCPMDPCADEEGNDCSASATCTRVENPLSSPNYTCQCPKGLMGNGHACRPGIDPEPKPMVKFDGVTPTEETLKNNLFCDCTKPEVDACQGFTPCKGNNEMCIVTAGNRPTCGCRPGYVNNNDGYGCVDETAPVLKLRHDPHGDTTLRLKQGDVYKEQAVDIIDDNAEEYMRSLRITYSAPLPPGCLTKIGEFHVNYTVATPWTSPPYVRITRRVIIEDIDECTLDVSRYQESCPALIPHCDVEAGAACVNTIGSYTCKCPKYSSGDGFQKGLSLPSKDVPTGFKGGTSCVDTSRPSIKLLGPTPKVFKVCKCAGLTGIMGNKNSPSSEVEQICRNQRDLYDGQLKEMIRSTSGAELCATHSKPKPKSTDCFKATDVTYKGAIDLTSRVKVGEPVQKSDLLWSVPYDVVDNAGNKALTAWRDVVVEEVELFDLEQSVRNQMLAEKEHDIEIAVQAALDKERAARQKKEPATRVKPETKQCPACPKCECAHGQTAFDHAKCEKYCDEKIAAMGGTCIAKSHFATVWDYLDSAGPMVVAVVSIVVIFMFIYAVRFFATLLFNPRAFVNGQDTYDAYGAAQRERAMQNAVTYHRSPPPPPTPLQQSTPQNGGSGIFSPPDSRQGAYGESPFLSPLNGGGVTTPGSRDAARFGDSQIYADSVIHPNANGDLRRRY